MKIWEAKIKQHNLLAEKLIQLEVRAFCIMNPDTQKHERTIKMLFRAGKINGELPIGKALKQALKYARKIDKKIKEDTLKEIQKIVRKLKRGA